MEAIESEVRRMENQVAEIKASLSSPETLASPREESLKVRHHVMIVSEIAEVCSLGVGACPRCRPRKVSLLF